MAETLELSVVVPMHNEAGNAGALVAEIAAALDGRAYEMIMVDDASTDDTRAVCWCAFPARRLQPWQRAG